MSAGRPKNREPDNHQVTAISDTTETLCAYTTLTEELTALKKKCACLEIELDCMNKVINLIRDGIVISDNRGIVLKANLAVEHLTGLSISDLVGKDLRQLTNAGVFINEPASFVARRQKSMVNLIQEYYTGKKLLVSASPIFNSEGVIERVVSYLCDISESTNVQEELEKARQINNSHFHTESTEVRMQQALGHKIIAHSSTFLRTIELATRVAQTDSTVLILGESGVGKEVIAHLIYQFNKRREKGAFVKINCGAIPEELLESELFGYETGAFTGAKKEGKQGMFELAQQGVIFLDEIAELSLRLQVKLLRVLQEKEFFRLGSVKPIKADVQIITATNKDLLEAVKMKQFREDLYYRLNVVPIVVPPLRERWEDIVPLILLYLNLFNEKYKQSKFFSSECLKVMLSYSWPGNVRQLANLIERLVVTCAEQMIGVQDLPEEIIPPSSISDRFLNNEDLSLPQALADLEKEMVEWTMRRYGSTYKAAKVLGVSQSTVARCVKKYGLIKNSNTGWQTGDSG